MIVDSHQHLWDLERVEYPWLVPEYGPIYRTFTPDELEPQLAAAGVDRTVLVQSANSFEDTDSMLAHAAERPGSARSWAGCRSRTPRRAPEALDDRYLRDPQFRGVRHLNHTEADPDWLVRPSGHRRAARARGARAGLRGRGGVPAAPGTRADARAGAVPTCASSSTTSPSRRSRSGDWRLEARPRGRGGAPERPRQGLRAQHGRRLGDVDGGHDLVEPIGYAIDVFGPDG